MRNTEKQSELSSWQVYLLLGVIFVAVILGVVQFFTKSTEEDPVDNQPEIVLSEASCKAAGGAWNVCGSACRGQEEGEPCISLCVEYCECSSDLQCPYGFSCTDIIDDIGICTNTF